MNSDLEEFSCSRSHSSLTEWPPEAEWYCAVASRQRRLCSNRFDSGLDFGFIQSAMKAMTKLWGRLNGTGLKFYRNHGPPWKKEVSQSSTLKKWWKETARHCRRISWLTVSIDTERFNWYSQPWNIEKGDQRFVNSYHRYQRGGGQKGYVIIGSQVQNCFT